MLIELKSLTEKQPHIFALGAAGSATPSRFDQDAIAALAQLGYTNQDILHVLDALPRDLTTTEERVTAALRSL